MIQRNWILIGVIVIALGWIFLNFDTGLPFDTQENNEANVLNEPVLNSETVETSVNFLQNSVTFADEKDLVSTIFMSRKVDTENEDEPFVFQGREYQIVINKSSKVLEVTYNDLENKKMRFSVPYENEAFSKNSVSFSNAFDEKEAEFKYFVFENENLVYFFLTAQSFPLQGQNFLRFEGTDTDGDGAVDIDYYARDAEAFGFDSGDSMPLVGHFVLSNKGKDVKVFVNTLNDALIVPDETFSYYLGPVMFDGKFFNETGKTAVDSAGNQFQLDEKKVLVVLAP